MTTTSPHDDASSSHGLEPHCIAPPAGPIYRVASVRRSPFAPVPWARVGFSRFDGPPRAFRTVYAATTQAAACGETLARYRATLLTLAEMSDVRDRDESLPAALGTTLAATTRSSRHARGGSGVVPADWCTGHHIGITVVAPHLQFVDLVHPDTVTHLRHALATLLVTRGLPDFDLAAVFSADRVVTQECARYLHRLHDANGRPLVAGIRYPSRLHLGWECWALFGDRVEIGAVRTSVLRPGDASVREACAVLNLSISAGTTNQ